MAGNNLSLKAGTVCATCNNPDPCLQSVVVGEFDGVTHTWPVEPQIHLKVVDKGEGVKGWFSVESKCGKPDCPEATLVYDHKSKALPPEVCNAETLYYKEPGSLDANNINIDSMWSYLNNIITPKDIFAEPHSYQLYAQGCIEKIGPVTIDVYPYIQLHVATGFTYELEGRERTWKERRDEQKKQNKLMHDVRPKNGNKLRGGWTVHTDQFEITNKSKLTLDYALSICGKDYSDSFAHKTKALKKVKSLEQISKVEQFISNIQNHLLPDPTDAKKDRSFKAVEMNFNPISFGIAYAYERLDTVKDSVHYIGFNADPFVSVSIKLDIIQLIAAYAKSEAIVAKCREIMRENLNVESYLQFTMNASMDVGAAYTKREWSFKLGEDNKLYGNILGFISFGVKAKCFFAEIAFQANGSAETTFGLALDQHESGLDLVGYHEGIKAHVLITADATLTFKKGRKKGQGKTNNPNKKEGDNDIKVTEDVLLADPLKIAESKLRVNLFGKQRFVEQRNANVIQPWAMGYNSLSHQ